MRTANRSPLACLAAVAALLLFAPAARAHLGAQVRDKATHIHDLVKAFEAEDVVAGKGVVQTDPLASGGKSVVAPAGTRFNLTTPALPRGMYAFYIVGRMDAAALKPDADGPDVLLRMTIDAGRDAAAVTYSDLHAMYNDQWQYVQELYFHADDAKRAYHATIDIQPDSPGALIIDRIELRDALSGVEFGAFKRDRYLYTPEEAARIAAQGRPSNRAPMSPDDRAARDRRIATQVVPEINSLSDDEFPKQWNRLRNDFEECLGGVHRKSNAETFLLTGDPVLARDTAFQLAIAAYRWPAFNFRLTKIHFGKNDKVNRLGEFKRQWGKLHIYRGWTGPMVRGMLRSYDILFPFIKDNQELATALSAYIPWVKTPRDVVALMDSYLVQESWRDYQRHQGASPIELVCAVLGPCDLSERLLARYSEFGDDIVNNYSRDGLTYIGSTYYAAAHSDGSFATADLLARYVAAGGNARWNVADPSRFPRMTTIFDSLLGLSVAGGFRNNTGDLGNPDSKGRAIYESTVQHPDEFFLRGWRWTRNPTYAWLLVNRLGIPKDVTDAEREAIAADAAKARDPLLYQRSRVQDGFGIAVLEAGQDVPDPRFKRTVVIRTGIASGHAQSDSLNLALFAYGCRMAPDLGGRARGEYGRPSTHLTRLHNAVEVDKQPIGGLAINATSYAWVNAFKPADGVQYIDAAAHAESHPQVTLYQRNTALVDISPGRPEGANPVLPNFYVFDVFRVRGGTTHTWCFHGAVSDQFDAGVPLKPAGDEAAAYLRGHQPGTLQEGVSADPMEATWRLRREEETIKVGENTFTVINAEKDFLGAQFDPGAPGKFTRATLFGHGGEKVMSGNTWCNRARRYSWPVLYVQKETERAQSSVYPAIIEPFAGESAIAAKRRLAVWPTEQGAEAAVALAVTTRALADEPAHDDVLFSGEQPEKEYRVGDDLTVRGRFAYVSTDADGVRALGLVGGRTLRRGELAVELPLARYEAKIAAVDYAQRALTLDKALPEALLAGEHARLGNPQHRSDYDIIAGSRADGRGVLRWAKSAATYGGSVRDVVADQGYIVPDSEPPLFDYHPHYYDGMTAVSESGRTWTVNVERGDRWMYLGFPVAAQAANRLSWKDIPDADGDGKRTLRMYVSGRGNDQKLLPDGTRQKLAVGAHMLDFEVTRISDDGLQFWYKQHPMEFVDSLGVPHRGWPYHDQVLKNEDGSRHWLSVLPEDDVRIYLQGGPVDDAALPDADGDGRRRIAFYEFGCGDSFEIEAHVFVRRLADGSFEVRANAPVSLALPEKGGVKKINVDEAALVKGGGVVVVK